jgi:hypothetical protein
VDLAVWRQHDVVQLEIQMCHAKRMHFDELLCKQPQDSQRPLDAIGWNRSR